MILSGQDLAIVTGAIWMYLDGPIHPDVRGSLSEDDRRVLDDLGERVHEARDAEWKRAGTEGAPTRREVIERRLAVPLEWLFTEREANLLAQALEACAFDLDTRATYSSSLTWWSTASAPNTSETFDVDCWGITRLSG